MTLYLDTSSLVKLYVAEPGSDAVRMLVDAATVVTTSAVAYTETRAALARRRRERTLRPGAFASAKKAFEAEWPRYFAVDVTSDRVRVISPRRANRREGGSMRKNPVVLTRKTRSERKKTFAEFVPRSTYCQGQSSKRSADIVGATAEEIAQRYASVPLADVYAYCLRHTTPFC